MSEKICPLAITQQLTCYKKHCAWWDETNNQCVLKTLAGIRPPIQGETFRQRLEREHPYCIDPLLGGGAEGCPHDYGYEKSEVCPAEIVMDDTIKDNCKACWDRVIPEGEEE